MKFIKIGLSVLEIIVPKTDRIFGSDVGFRIGSEKKTAHRKFDQMRIKIVLIKNEIKNLSISLVNQCFIYSYYIMDSSHSRVYLALKETKVTKIREGHVATKRFSSNNREQRSVSELIPTNTHLSTLPPKWAFKKLFRNTIKNS